MMFRVSWFFFFVFLQIAKSGILKSNTFDLDENAERIAKNDDSLEFNERPVEAKNAQSFQDTCSLYITSLRTPRL